MMDGYNFLDTSRSNCFKQFLDNQRQVNGRLKEIASEMVNLPRPPKYMEDWIEGWTTPEGQKSFDMSVLKKLVNYKKEYNKLIEVSDTNIREMKVLIIDDLIDKINSTLEDADSDKNTIIK